MLGKALIYAARFQSPFDYPQPHLFTKKRESRRGLGVYGAGSRLGTGASSGLPGMSPAITVAMKQCWRRRLGSTACSPLQSGHGFRKGDSAREGSLLAPPLNCPCSHLGSQAVAHQGLENSKPRAWGFLLQPFFPSGSYVLNSPECLPWAGLRSES